jgi:hypothetical protein
MGVSIVEMIRVGGAKRSDIATILDLQLIRFCKSINLSVPLTDYQKQEIVMTMMEQYRHETLNDFLLMFRNARNGLYGPIYNRMDITVISEYMARYLDAKSFERENIEREIQSHIIAMEKHPEFKTPEEYQAWKKQWYDGKLTLRDKLVAVQKKFERMERMGIPANKELEYQKFREQYIKTHGEESGVHTTKTETATEKQTTDDIRTGGTMDGHDDPGADQNVPVFIGNGSDDIESIQREGSEHHQQSDVVQSQSETLH